MKKYFNEGLLPDEYVEEGFRRLLEIRKGTIGEQMVYYSKKRR